MFLYLIAFIIVLSQILYWFDVSVTTEIAVHEDQVVPTSRAKRPMMPVVDNEDPLQHPPPPNLDESDYVIETETIEVNGLLTTDGIRFIFSSFVRNFANFTVVATIFVAMIGVGVAEEAGLMGALIRKLVKVAPSWALAFIIILVGGLSSIATDAGYLILIPARCRGVPQRRTSSARRSRRCIRRRERSIRRQRPHHACRCARHRDDQ